MVLNTSTLRGATRIQTQLLDNIYPPLRLHTDSFIPALIASTWKRSLSGSAARWIEQLPGAHRQGCGITHRLLLTAGSNPATCATFHPKFPPPPDLVRLGTSVSGYRFRLCRRPPSASPWMFARGGGGVEPTDVHPDVTEGSVGPPSPDLLPGCSRTAARPRSHIHESVSQHNPPTGKPTKDQTVLRS